LFHILMSEARGRTVSTQRRKVMSGYGAAVMARKMDGCKSGMAKQPRAISHPC
jgi:hypothetical protein